MTICHCVGEMIPAPSETEVVKAVSVSQHCLYVYLKWKWSIKASPTNRDVHQRLVAK